jgi:hypothetical protein
MCYKINWMFLAAIVVFVAMLAVRGIPANADVIPFSSAVSPSVSAVIITPNVTYGIMGSDPHEQTSTLDPLSGTTSGEVSIQNAKVDVNNSVNATWIDASQGYVSLCAGWSEFASPATNGNFAVGGGWQYVFTGDDSPATINLDYTASLTGGNTIGANGFRIDLIRASKTSGYTEVIESGPGGIINNGYWTATMPSLSDPDYAFGIRIFSSGGINGVLLSPGLDAQMQGTFNWSIMQTSVPEPSTLVLLGFGAASLLVYAWRRSQS